MTRPSPKQKTIPPLVLLSFALIHSQFYWLYSVIYHLCHNLSDRPVDLDQSVLDALTKRSGRTRAFSEPQQPSTIILQQRQAITATSSKTRPRSTTISATTVDADAPLRKQQWVKHVQACINQQQLMDPTEKDYILDERMGRTRPPRWWQRTRKHLIRQDKMDSDINIHSTLSLPGTTHIDSATTSTNSKQSQPVSLLLSATQSSCDPQQHIPKPNDIISSSSSSSSSTTTLSSPTQHCIITSASSSSSPPSVNLPTKPFMESSNQDLSTTTITTNDPNNNNKRRPLAKIRSVFIKSQIEPEKVRSQLDRKRKTILGIPSRWSSPPTSTTITTKSTTMVTMTNHSTSSQPSTQKQRLSVRIKEPKESSPKKRLFSSLPNWKRMNGKLD
ncbi:uncharacterized protein BX664DRAFT_326184, partial [Halteromyces radiatus]|uniref:uncharacterized protein n=1 Tax=Halteromyces radiatus TaxID=101107 RepID=UPI00221F803A